MSDSVSMSLAYFVLPLVIYVLAVMRLTKLINSDIILDPIRIRIARRFGPNSTLVYVLNCPWCVGMWIALAGAIPTVWVLGLAWLWVIPLGLACSQLVGMFAPLYTDDDIEFESVESD